MTDVSDAIRDSARSFLRGSDQHARTRALNDDHGAGRVDRDYWRRMADLGWLLITVPEADGGLGLGLTQAVLIAEEAGRCQLPEPYVASGLLPMEVLRNLPASNRRNLLLASIGAGETLAAVAWQTRPGQLTLCDDASSSGVRAKRVVSDEWRLDGVVGFIPSGGSVDGWLLVARHENETILLWVAAAMPGISVTSVARADAGSISELRLEDVRVSASDMLGFGVNVSQVLNDALEAARIVTSAELIGVARHTLSTTVDYVNTRHQFGRAVGSFQALQHRLVDALLQIELAAASLADALQRWDFSLPGDQREMLASRVKSRANRAAREVTRLSIQLHGAIGYTDEYEVGLYFKRALNLSTWLGNATAHQLRFSHLTMAAAHSETSSEGVVEWGSKPFPEDADWDGMPEVEFRGMLRAFFAAHYPDALRHMPWRLHWHEIESWYLTLSRQRWIAPSWPREHGGMALSPSKLIAYIEECERYGIARAPDQGLVMLGPILSRFGTAAQQAAFMPQILSGEHVWAQGYSEPDAGSDLAALRCEALIDGTDFVVTGQKTWSTLAQDATHMFMLVRTDKTVKKQAGISFLMVDLRSPGVTIRAIETLSGDAEFAEVFFDAVRVPQFNLVGELNGGWNIAKALLGFERLFSGSPKHCHYALGQIIALAAQHRYAEDPVFAHRLAGLQLDAADLSTMYSVFADIAKRGLPLPAEVSLLKIWATETHERIGTLLIDMADEWGGAHARSAYPNTHIHVQAPYLAALAATIFSGTNEVQRNILAKQVLGLAIQ